jgi:preprotein translocase subunit Sec63
VQRFVLAVALPVGRRGAADLPALKQVLGISLHTPVPRQIQDAASRLGIGRVYGDFWLVCEGSTEEEEIAAAEAQYNVNLYEEGSAEEEESTGDESQYEDSDIYFSEYEDDDCPDDMLSPSDEKDTVPRCYR